MKSFGPQVPAFETAAGEALAGARDLRPLPAREPRPQRTRPLRLRLYALLLLIDSAALLAGLLLAGAVRFGEPVHRESIDTFLILWPVYVAVALNGRVYAIESLASPRTGISRACQALLLALAVTTVMLFSFKAGSDFSRLVFGIGAVAALAFLALGRSLAGGPIGRRHGWRFQNELLLVDGAAALPAGAEEVVFADRAGLAPALDDPAMLDRLGRLIEHRDRVILACPPERRGAWAQLFKGANVDVEILAPELERVGALEMRRWGSRATFLVARGPLGLRDRAIKRALDLALAGLAILLLAPVMAALAVAVAVDSGGPVLFRQPRVGRGNRTFTMLKFRSMRSAAADPAGARSASRDDDRVTRVGRFLRRTSLDELPQLLNVLKGEMSIVGPRPHALSSTAEDRLFWAIDERYWDRHAIKPGMTGLAQIRGFRGATAKSSDLTDRLQADLEYLTGWTVWRDLGIVAATLRVMVHRNAF